MLKGIDDKEAGRYRHENVVIAGASTTPLDILHLPTGLLLNFELLKSGYPTAVIRKEDRLARVLSTHTSMCSVCVRVNGPTNCTNEEGEAGVN
ncbi:MULTISPECIES: hypothetical protein [Burkholderiaceae]|uniref:hypothetical protein n=1 Tax=Burkholderiaceae TaxID=119060 RepID=UPI000976DCDF|nr:MULTISPECIES: hypothetical protein [Burkholderiaceae]